MGVRKFQVYHGDSTFEVDCKIEDGFKVSLSLYIDIYIYTHVYVSYIICIFICKSVSKISLSKMQGFQLQLHSLTSLVPDEQTVSVFSLM